MKKFFMVLFFALLSQCFAFSSTKLNSLYGSNPDIKGIWQGTLKISSVQLRIVFHISRDEKGNFKATMDSPDQGAKDIPVDSVSFTDGSLKLVINVAHGFYQGIYNADSVSFTGNWNQMGQSLPLVLHKIEKEEAVNRPQEPKPPFPYKVEDVVYENKSAGIKLGGTITMPESGGPFPAVLLITGSGQQNRDEELFGHKPFLVIADYLTRHGIAVLRVDDRGIGESTGNFAASTSKDFVSDVLTGVEYLKGRKEINPKEIGLIGHSEGGMIAPMAADETKDVAFIVLMAGPGITGEQVLLTQTEAIQKLSGVPEDQIKKGLVSDKKMYDAIMQGKDSTQIVDELQKIFNDSYNSLSEEQKKQLSDPKAGFDMVRNRLMSPWFRYFVAYNPVPVLEKVKCPVLAIDGSKDLQVLPEQNLAAIKKALQAGGNKNFEVKELPGLNHIFQTAETGLPTEYGRIDETISPIALKTMGDWILKVTKN